MGENSPFDPEAFICLEQGPQDYCHAVHKPEMKTSLQDLLWSVTGS